MPQRTKDKSLKEKGKAEGLPPHSAMPLDTLGGVRGEMGRLYRLGIAGKLEPDRMTKFVYVLRELRACIESEQVPAAIADIQTRLAALTAMGDRRG